MRVASSVAASIQQAQTKERNDINKNQDKSIDNKQQEKAVSFSNEKNNDKVSQIKEDIKNGKYKMNLMATADKMAQSLLNV